MPISAAIDDDLLSRILAAETFHVLIDEEDVVRGRGIAIMELHAAPGVNFRTSELLRGPRPEAGPLSFDHLKTLAGQPLTLEYTPLGLRLRGQFIVSLRGHYGVFLGAPEVLESGELKASGVGARELPRHYGLLDSMREIHRAKLALDESRRQTERLTLQRTALQSVVKRLHQEAEDKSRFLATMSHELRSPLDGLLGVSQLLLATELGIEQREYLNLALQSGETLLHVVNDVLELSRLEAGRLPLVQAVFEPSRLLERVARQFRFRAIEADVGIEVSASAAKGTAYCGDERRIAQVLNNLLGNAVKFSQPGGQVWLRMAEQSAAADHVMLHFSVIDNGVGIRADALDQIFEPYRQADDSIAGSFGGSGLGLSICRRLVELMQGRIWVSSSEGIGTAFHFTVRAARAPLAELFVAVPPAADRGRCMRTAHPAPAGQEPEVLLVEDNLVSQKIASAFLRNSGYVTRIAGNGAEALERLHADRGRFVAVLMDCQMPVMDGYALTRALRQEEREHPELRRLRIIAMTANAMEGDRERCLEAGMDDYIAKPVDPDRLVALLEAMG